MRTKNWATSAWINNLPKLDSSCAKVECMMKPMCQGKKCFLKTHLYSLKDTIEVKSMWTKREQKTSHKCMNEELAYRNKMQYKHSFITKLRINNYNWNV
jgi:hypothetical protein